ncbi:MAG: DUF3786 domain-containing protein, partial [Actinomycetia bacterium]|nr:DUF3786 domain-containing protein [Actinomycetes bacterium]
PHHRFQPLQALCPSPIAGSGSDANWQAAEIERIFGQAEQKVSPTMTAFGAQAVESGSSADATWRLMALPKMPMELRYYRADEEFPCSVDILVDQTAMTFLPFEALGELVGYIYEELAHIAKSL